LAGCQPRDEKVFHLFFSPFVCLSKDPQVTLQALKIRERQPSFSKIL
jgi:hypothetical protein